MKTQPRRDRFRLIAATTGSRLSALARDVRLGLTSNPKRVPCCYFYDGEGSLLFEQICELPEYYVSRAEREILEARASDIASRFAAPVALVELGSGSAMKTRLLIEALLNRQSSLRFVPIDICSVMLEESSRRLLEDYPGLEILAIAAEYYEGLRYLQTALDQPKLILWLGSNIGNFDRLDAVEFLRQVRKSMTAADCMLIGIDLRKEPTVLERAYDDSQGVTAEFNVNLLARINRELGGRFDLDTFRHRAVYDEELGRIEMYLVSKRAQPVRIDNLDLEVSLAAGEAIHTENSYKYSVEEIEAVATSAGFRIGDQWFDSLHRFCVNLFLPVDGR